MTTITLETRELAAVLSGLRLVQCELTRGKYLPQGVHDIFDNCDTIIPLDVDEIDALCEAINSAPDAFSYIEDDEVITLSPARHKLAAIRARISGAWDHPALVHFGPLTPNTNTDILTILSA